VPFWEAVVALVLFSGLFGVTGYYTGQEAADSYYEPLLREAHSTTDTCIRNFAKSEKALEDSREDFHDLYKAIGGILQFKPGDDADKVLKKLCDAALPDGKRPPP
jgi:hypothetical protein